MRGVTVFGSCCLGAIKTLRFLAFVVCASGLLTSVSFPAPDKYGKWVAGQILVQPRASVSRGQLRNLLAPQDAHSTGTIPGINVHIISVPAGAEDRVLTALSHNPNIEFCEKDQLLKPGNYIPNDPKFPDAWHLQAMNLPDVWELSRGDGITVAVLDTGVNSAHADLYGKLVSGWNIVSNNSDTSDVFGHGTKVAGIIGALMNNGLGVASIAPDALIMPVRITNSPDGWASISAIATGITWAADHGAQVANVSYEVTSSPSVRSAAEYMRGRGGLVVAAAGNSGTDLKLPDSSAIISVAATTGSDARARWSNVGDYIDVAAPGTGIWTTNQTGGYSAVTGTSFAAPVTAATLALIMAANSSLTADDVEDVLENSAIDLGDSEWDPEFGNGRVDPLAAVLLAGGQPLVDDQSPTVGFITPQDGAAVNGIISVNASAYDNITVSRVELYDDTGLVETDDSSPYGFRWDTARVAEGFGTELTLVAYDSSGNTATQSISVHVADSTPPVISAPGNKTVEATGSLTRVALGSASAVDNVDGNVTVTADKTGPFTVATHVITWTASDSAGNTATAIQTVTVRDSTSPRITPPPDRTVEASGPLTPVSLGSAMAVDDKDGSVIATPELTGPFAPGTTIVIWSASDSEGNTATAAQQITVMDTLPPQIDAPEDITVAASGVLNTVDLGVATVFDLVSGELDPVSDHNGPFTSGRYTVTWSVADAAGNAAHATQLVTVLPQVDFTLDQVASEGSAVTVTVKLSGTAADYPVIVPFVVTGSASNPLDHTARDGEIIISSGTRGSLFFETVDNGVNGTLPGTVIFDMQSPTNAVPGSHMTHTVTIIEDNAPPVVELTVAQAGMPVRTVYPFNGAVVVTAAVTDPDPGDEHSYDWSLSDNRLVPTSGTAGAQFTFDPEYLAPGIHTLRVTTTDNGSPAESVSVEIVLNVVATAPVLSDASDQDGDGRSDAVEGLGDIDQDGISDFLDAISNPVVLQGINGVSDHHLLATEPGAKLRLGATALAAGQASAFVIRKDIMDYGGTDGQPGVNSDDGVEYPGGLFDFVITGLTGPGQSVRVVLPQLAPLASGAVYRKYAPESGWQDFIIDGNNTVASARGSNGVCPAPGDPGYQDGLHAGDHCVQLTLEDGGPNDLDGLRNGVIRDPGGARPVPQASGDDSVSGSGNGGGGGGCSINPAARMDPVWLFLLIAPAIGALCRRGQAECGFSPGRTDRERWDRRARRRARGRNWLSRSLFQTAKSSD